MESFLPKLKDVLKPPLPTSDFRVFVFGPAMQPDEIVAKPTDPADTHDRIVAHAKYLRYLTKIRLTEQKFTVDFGETSEILSFWSEHLKAVDPATCEEHHAARACGAVVIFPSSVGSICELGLFAPARDIAQKSLAIVHEGFSRDNSFFRKGLLEIFEQEKGKPTFINYERHDDCVAAAVKFVCGEYSSILRTVRNCKVGLSRIDGTIFQKALKPSVS